MIRNFNLTENLVPFQSLSLLHQQRCIELFGNPDETRQKGIPPVYKNHSETDTLSKTCMIEYKSQLPPKTSKLLCEICSQLLNEILSHLPSNSYLTAKKQGQQCFLESMAALNQRRRETGGPRISHSQDYKWMKDALKFAKFQTDNDLLYIGQNNLPQDLISKG
jgi:hypothetical protein